MNVMCLEQIIMSLNVSNNGWQSVNIIQCFQKPTKTGRERIRDDVCGMPNWFGTKPPGKLVKIYIILNQLGIKRVKTIWISQLLSLVEEQNMSAYHAGKNSAHARIQNTLVSPVTHNHASSNVYGILSFGILVTAINCDRRTIVFFNELIFRQLQLQLN